MPTVEERRRARLIREGVIPPDEVEAGAPIGSVVEFDPEVAQGSYSDQPVRVPISPEMVNTVPMLDHRAAKDDYYRAAGPPVEGDRNFVGPKSPYGPGGMGPPNLGHHYAPDTSDVAGAGLRRGVATMHDIGANVIEQAGEHFPLGGKVGFLGEALLKGVGGAYRDVADELREDAEGTRPGHGFGQQAVGVVAEAAPQVAGALALTNPLAALSAAAGLGPTLGYVGGMSAFEAARAAHPDATMGEVLAGAGKGAIYGGIAGPIARLVARPFGLADASGLKAALARLSIRGSIGGGAGYMITGDPGESALMAGAALLPAPTPRMPRNKLTAAQRAAGGVDDLGIVGQDAVDDAVSGVYKIRAAEAAASGGTPSERVLSVGLNKFPWEAQKSAIRQAGKTLGERVPDIQKTQTVAETTTRARALLGSMLDDPASVTGDQIDDMLRSARESYASGGPESARALVLLQDAADTELIATAARYRLAPTPQNHTAVQAATKRVLDVFEPLTGESQALGRGLNILQHPPRASDSAQTLGGYRLARDAERATSQAQSRAARIHEIVSRSDSVSKEVGDEVLAMLPGDISRMPGGLQQLQKFMTAVKDARTYYGDVRRVMPARIAAHPLLAARELFINNVLSGVTTHAKNIGSTAGYTMWDFFGGKVAGSAVRALRHRDTAYLAEPYIRFLAMESAWDDAMRAGVGAFRELPADDIARMSPGLAGRRTAEVMPRLLAQRKLDIPDEVLPSIARIPTRMLGAEDVTMKAIILKQAIAGRAYREGLKRGITDKADLYGWAGARLENPTDDLLNGAVFEAERLTFTNPLDGLERSLQDLRTAQAGSPVGSFAQYALTHYVPFLRTPLNVMKRAVGDPFGAFLGTPFYREARRLDPEGEWAKSVMNLAVMGAMGHMIWGAVRHTDENLDGAMVPSITGAMPESAGGRQSRYEAGVPGNAVRPAALANDALEKANLEFRLPEGTRFVDYSWFEPGGTNIGLMVDATPIARSWVRGEIGVGEFGFGLLNAVRMNVLQKTYFEGADNLVDTIKSPERSANRSIAGIIAPMMIPGYQFLRQEARRRDEHTVRIETGMTFADHLANRIQGAIPGTHVSTPLGAIRGREMLQPRIGALGTEQSSGSTLGGAPFSPVRTQEASNDPVAHEMLRLDTAIAAPRNFIASGDLFNEKQLVGYARSRGMSGGDVQRFVDFANKKRQMPDELYDRYSREVGLAVRARMMGEMAKPQYKGESTAAQRIILETAYADTKSKVYADIVKPEMRRRVKEELESFK